MKPVNEQDLVRFVHHEARLIDEKRFSEWYELFTEDALYWMPLAHGQNEGRTHNSLFHEDRLLLRVRIERLRSPHSFSQAQPSWCQHVLQAPSIEQSDQAAGRFVLRTPFLYAESQKDEQQIYAAVAWHHLVLTDAGLRIQTKKIDLLNRRAALPSIQLFL